MIRTLIVDDEANNRERLHRMIADHFPRIEIIGEVDGVATGVKAINDLHPELVLLDIKMGDGDAFDLLEKVGDIFFKIIFITAFEEYAVKAFKFSALDYLLKPVQIEQLRNALDKAESQIMDELKLKLNGLQLNIKSKEAKTLVLKTSEKIFLLKTSDIIRCESDWNYTKFYSAEGQQYMVSQSLKQYEDILAGHGFFRIHKSHIVNLSFIKSFDKKNEVVTLKEGTSLPVSRRKKAELIELFDKL
jgi:two-component system LytT family response regulator